MSRALLAVLTPCGDASGVPLGRILGDLGDRSFGWSILVFGLLNMMPMPKGSNMITSIPLLLLTAQMVLGISYVALTRFIARRRGSRRGVQRTQYAGHKSDIQSQI